MRFLLTASLIISVGVLLFVAGNMMRCISTTSDPCPKLCYQKVKDCSHDNSGDCVDKKICRAPDATQYSTMINGQLRSFKNFLR